MSILAVEVDGTAEDTLRGRKEPLPTMMMNKEGVGCETMLPLSNVMWDVV